MRILGKCTIVLLALTLMSGCTWTKKFLADTDPAAAKAPARERS